MAYDGVKTFNEISTEEGEGYAGIAEARLFKEYVAEKVEELTEAIVLERYAALLEINGYDEGFIRNVISEAQQEPPSLSAIKKNTEGWEERLDCYSMYSRAEEEVKDALKDSSGRASHERALGLSR